MTSRRTGGRIPRRKIKITESLQTLEDNRFHAGKRSSQSSYRPADFFAHQVKVWQHFGHTQADKPEEREIHSVENTYVFFPPKLESAAKKHPVFSNLHRAAFLPLDVRPDLGTAQLSWRERLSSASLAWFLPPSTPGANGLTGPGDPSLHWRRASWRLLSR